MLFVCVVSDKLKLLEHGFCLGYSIFILLMWLKYSKLAVFILLCGSNAIKADFQAHPHPHPHPHPLPLPLALAKCLQLRFEVLATICYLF